MCKMKYAGCSDAQAQYGNGDDPRKFLKIGEVYEILDEEVYHWYTLYHIMVDGVIRKFNSVCFKARP